MAMGRSIDMAMGSGWVSGTLWQEVLGLEPEEAGQVVLD